MARAIIINYVISTFCLETFVSCVQRIEKFLFPMFFLVDLLVHIPIVSSS